MSHWGIPTSKGNICLAAINSLYKWSPTKGLKVESGLCSMCAALQGKTLPMQVDKVSHWGDIESEDEESEEEEEDEPMGVEDAVPDDVASLDGMSSVATGVSSLPSGLETPEVLDLRKAKAGGGCSCYSFGCFSGC